MAEIVLSAFLTAVFEKLASAALKKLARSKGIQSELMKWEHDILDELATEAMHRELTHESAGAIANKVRTIKLTINSYEYAADIDLV
ncbi:hypothetical protein Tco_1074979 [Tanacetum coccineum]